MENINVSTGFGLHQTKAFAEKFGGKAPTEKKIEKKAESEAVVADTQIKTPSMMDVIPAQFLIGFAVGSLLAMYSANWYFESKYGPVMEALPAIERAKAKAEENDMKIQSLVEANKKNKEDIEASVDKIMDWASDMKPKVQTVSR